MKAAVRDEYGSSEVVYIDDVPVPEIGKNEVLIRVKAAGLDAGVWHHLTGTPLLVRYLGLGVKKPKQRVLGMDVAGIVEKVGSGVTAFKPGDDVFGVGTGTFAEFAVAKAKTLVLKPAGVTFEEAAASPISGITALQAVRAGEIGSTSRVLVLGAAGGVGHFAVQLAKSQGAHVTGVGRAAKLDFIRSLGVDEALDYGTVDVTDGSRIFDLIVDTGGNRPISDLRRALTPTGTLVIVGGEGAGGPVLRGLDRSMRAGVVSLFTKQKLIGLVSLTNAKDLAELSAFLESGVLAPGIDRTFDVADAAAAMAHYERGATSGKIAIKAP